VDQWGGVRRLVLRRPETQTAQRATLPASKGSYILVVEVRQPGRIRVGKAGELTLRRGYYYYAGSAFGPGGLAARLRRYLSGPRSTRWHIDYLLGCGCIVEIWYATGERSQEHDWARRLAASPNLRVPLAGFGSSDCRCPAHLFFSRRKLGPGILAQENGTMRGETEAANHDA